MVFRVLSTLQSLGRAEGGQSHWPAASSLHTGQDSNSLDWGPGHANQTAHSTTLTATGRSQAQAESAHNMHPVDQRKGTYTSGPQRMFPALDHFSEIPKYNQHIKYRVEIAD